MAEHDAPAEAEPIRMRPGLSAAGRRKLRQQILDASAGAAVVSKEDEPS